MKERFKRWFTHNILLKLVALSMAILTWLAFYSSEDPIIAAYFDVPVEVVNLEEFNSQGHYIAFEGENDLTDLVLEVCVKGRTSVIERLRAMDPSSFIRAYVDVYEADENGVNRLLIHYEDVSRDTSLRFEFNDLKNKTYYDVNVDNSITKEIEVRYEITGTPEDGYMYLKDDANIQVNPEVITLTGPSAQLEKIDYGKVTIRVSGANANENKKGDIILHEADGDVVNYSRDVVRASVSEASVFVPVYMVKTVSVQPHLKGNVPAGYEYGKDPVLSVAKVDIYGPESVMNRISNIALPEVDLSTLTEDYSAAFDLNEILEQQYKGDVKVVDEEQSETTLTFSVGKQEAKSFEIETSQIEVAGNRNDWNVSFANSTFTLEVVGLPHNLEEFDPATAKFNVRLQEADFVTGRRGIEISVTELGEVSLKTTPLTVEMLFSKVGEASEPVKS